MSKSEVKKDLLSQLLYEAQSYKKFEDIEKLVEGGGDLSMIPVQPLYVSLQNTSKDQISLILPKLSQEQRQALLDIDLWQKDTIDPQAVMYWFEVYAKCPSDEVILEFVKSEDFLLGLKNQFTIDTFDVEDPMYPEGDNYFLTEDNQLLIEYPEDFNLVNELKEMIRRLYSDLGVENAYAFLFKMVVDSYQVMEENSFQEKKDRLRDFGFVDYFEALEYNSCFMSRHQLDQFIDHKKSLTGHLDSNSLNQNLHSTSLIPYQNGMDQIKDALDAVSKAERSQFLHFNFLRLVNARITLDDALKNGTLAMTKVGQQTKLCLELGFDYVQSRLSKEKVAFEVFDFIDFYKVGHSLLDINRRKIKKALSLTPFEKDDFSYFLGMYWNAFLENSYDELAKYKFDGSSKALEIRDVKSYSLWTDAIDTFVKALPYIQSFFLNIEKLKTSGLLNDQFYLNYEVDNIDFEAIIISSFINFIGGHFEDSTSAKMGVTVQEMKNFYHQFFTKIEKEFLIKGEEDPTLRSKLEEFKNKFGMHEISGFEIYMYQIMLEQLNGYEVDDMVDEDYKHIGGPILLNYTRN
jgi:hypothetical protein